MMPPRGYKKKSPYEKIADKIKKDEPIKPLAGAFKMGVTDKLVNTPEIEPEITDNMEPEHVEHREHKEDKKGKLDLSRFENAVPLGEEAFSVSAFLPSELAGKARQGEFGQEVDVNGITYVVHGFVEWKDNPGRIALAQKAGWDFLPTDMGDWGTPTVESAQSEPGSVINRPVGAGQTCYPMVKPIEWVRKHMKKYDDQADLVEKTIWRNFKGQQNPYKSQSEIGRTFFSNKPQDLE